ncbi:MAG: protein kinase [Candidatus Eiseniibacteriota bacterium]|nr:MAG: protein kinase [Candidatus Eisenbacteria bacterium]
MPVASFDLRPGHRIARKYEIIAKLGAGWEGEVYRIVELRTGIERAAKLFYPQRNVGNRASKLYARKLHKLRNCPALMKYHTEEIITFRRVPITALISEYVTGELLSDFLSKLPGKRLPHFEALHLLYALARGLESIHLMNEYHGDLHVDNVIVKRVGLSFEVKLIDLFHWEMPKKENRQSDICDLVRVFHASLGGARFYANQPDAVKYICSGLKNSLILQKFRTVSRLRRHLETMEW